MNIANNIGTAQHQNFAAVLLAPVIVQGRIALLDVRTHGAVVDYDSGVHELEKVGQLVLSSQFSVQFSAMNTHRELRTWNWFYTTTPVPLGPAFGKKS